LRHPPPGRNLRRSVETRPIQPTRTRVFIAGQRLDLSFSFAVPGHSPEPACQFSNRVPRHPTANVRDRYRHGLPTSAIRFSPSDVEFPSPGSAPGEPRRPCFLFSFACNSRSTSCFFTQRPRVAKPFVAFDGELLLTDSTHAAACTVHVASLGPLPSSPTPFRLLLTPLRRARNHFPCVIDVDPTARCAACGWSKSVCEHPKRRLPACYSGRVPVSRCIRVCATKRWAFAARMRFLGSNVTHACSRAHPSWSTSTSASCAFRHRSRLPHQRLGILAYHGAS